MHRSMATAIPEDILVFLTQHWLPNHAGSPTTSGKLIAAPTSLAGVKSHLAKEFDLQGRVGDLHSRVGPDPAAQLGKLMRNMIKGYHSQAAEVGYQKIGAMHLEEAKMLQLLQLEHMCSN